MLTQLTLSWTVILKLWLWGLIPIPAAGNFDVAGLVLNDMRLNIKRALYNDMLGDPNRTPATATEIAERMADLSRRIGSVFGRL